LSKSKGAIRKHNLIIELIQRTRFSKEHSFISQTELLNKTADP